MKNYDCYFPSFSFQIMEKDNLRNFKMALLAYDNIYVPSTQLNELLSLDSKKEDCNIRAAGAFDLFLGSINEVNTFILYSNYLNQDFEGTKELIRTKHIKTIYSDLLLQYHDQFLKEVFMEIPEGFSSNFPSAELFKAVLDYHNTYYYPPINNRRVQDLSIILRDLMIGDHISRKYGIDSVYSYSHLFCKEILSNIPSVKFDSEDFLYSDKLTYLSCINFSCSKIGKFYNSSDELFILNNQKQDKYSLLFQDVVPDLSSIPNSVIYEAKQKDRLLSLPRLANKLSESKDISDEDLVKYFDEQVWKLAENSLKVSVPSVVLDVLSWATISIPPLGLGIQLVTQCLGIYDYWTSKFNSGWIIPIKTIKDYKPEES